MGNAKYDVIFRKPSGKKEIQIGEPSLVQVGDVIGINTPRGYRALRVKQLFPRARKVKTLPVVYGETVLHRGETIKFEDFIEILRPKNPQAPQTPQAPIVEPTAAEPPAAKPSAEEEFVPPWLDSGSD